MVTFCYKFCVIVSFWPIVNDLISIPISPCLVNFCSIFAPFPPFLFLAFLPVTLIYAKNKFTLEITFKALQSIRYFNSQISLVFSINNDVKIKKYKVFMNIFSCKRKLPNDKSVLHRGKSSQFTSREIKCNLQTHHIVKMVKEGAEFISPEENLVSYLSQRNFDKRP